MTGSLSRPAHRRPTGTDERTHPHPAATREPPSDPLRAEHPRRPGAGPKALRPLTRSRSARALTPTPRRHASNDAERPETPVKDTLDAMKELRVGPRSA